MVLDEGVLRPLLIDLLLVAVKFASGIFLFVSAVVEEVLALLLLVVFVDAADGGDGGGPRLLPFLGLVLLSPLAHPQLIDRACD